MGTFMIEPEVTDLVALVKDTVKEQKPQMDAKQQSYTEVFGKPSLKLSIDIKLIRMIIQNLLSNAIKYTPNQGKIALEVKQAMRDFEFAKIHLFFGLPEKYSLFATKKISY
jgi:signal transduction histidine kinase